MWAGAPPLMTPRSPRARSCSLTPCSSFNGWRVGSKNGTVYYYSFDWASVQYGHAADMYAALSECAIQLGACMRLSSIYPRAWWTLHHSP